MTKRCEYCAKAITRKPRTHRDECRFCNQSCITAWGNKLRIRSGPDRFWARVVKTETCWLWQGETRPRGWYGRIEVDNVGLSTHRYSWMLHNGPVPEGLSVLHRCDVPLCVNPEHLFLGTQKDNMLDRKAKGRFVYTDAHRAKVTATWAAKRKVA